MDKVLQHKLSEIYNRYNASEDQPDIVTIVDDINYLLRMVDMMRMDNGTIRTNNRPELNYKDSDYEH